MRRLPPRSRWSRREFLRAAGLVALGEAPSGASRGLAPEPLAGSGAATGVAREALGYRGRSAVAMAAGAGGGRVVEGRSTLGGAAGFPIGGSGAQLGSPIHQRFADFSRHFLFEYYPWYGADPWRHWSNRDRRPPVDIAASSVPLLGAYDSTDTAVLDRHARWIREAGVGSIAVSWWGRESYSDRAVHRVMDAMRAHDVKVTFGLEPYRDDRAEHYVDDVLYLLNEFGDRRGWDSFLLLQDEGGVEGPVFKSFRTILPERVMDCHGMWHPVRDYTADEAWSRQTARLREILRRDFDRLTLLADSLDMGRTRDAGFDGIGIYDNFIGPELYQEQARHAAGVGLLFSFNVNPGYDEILERDPDPTGCYRPRPFEPPTPELSFASDRGRILAEARSTERIEASLAATVAVQDDPTLTNRRRGFFLVYINSFNEWHEGHAFEPMKDYDRLSLGEKELMYHNTLDGGFRLRVLANALTGLYGESHDKRVAS